MINCPVGTVKSRLHYARKVLKEGLEARYLAEQGETVDLARLVRNDTAYETSI